MESGYYYFPTKEAVLEGIMIDFAASFASEFEKISASFNARKKLETFIERLFIPNYIEDIYFRLWEAKQFNLFYITCKKSDAVFNSVLLGIIKQGNQDGTLQVRSIDETVPFLWSTLDCIWESLCHREAPAVFRNKIEIAASILERIFGIVEGPVTLNISPR